jgi:glycosyl transferase family 25
MEAIDGNSQFCFVIASFNNEANIEKNLGGLARQTNTNWRGIYVNDCSTDNTESLFFALVAKYNIKSKFTYIKNDKQYGQMYSKYTAYKLLKDFEIACILDGDDWLSDDNVLTRLSEIYSNKSVHMVSSNFNVWYDGEVQENYAFSKYPEDILTDKSFRKQTKWMVRHLKSGYGIFFKSIPKEYLTLSNGEWLKVATDVAEYYSALELSYGEYLAVDDVMYTYNKTNSLNYNTSYYNDESKELHRVALEHLLSLPPCKYSLPRTYIINMPKCTKKYEYMTRQMVFQSNTNFKFIEAIDGSTNSETGALMNKYYEYMGLQSKTQAVEYHRSKMLPAYKHKFNYPRQHITRGSLGLLQSAFLLLSEFVRSDIEHALILEDDVYTMKDLDKNLFLNEELLKGRDLVYLGCHTSRTNIFPEKSDSIFIDILNTQDLIYGTYSFIISKKLANYILSLGIDAILQLNISWDLLLNYIRETQKDQFTFFLYFKQVFIPNVIKKGGINPIGDLGFYIRNKITLRNYYIPEVTSEHTDNQIANVMSTHNENFFFDGVNKVVYINLEDRTDRRDHVHGQLSQYIHESKIRRFNAIRHERGAVGCGLSQIGILEMAIAENWDNVFIAEDDLTWTEYFVTGYDLLEKLLRIDYDVIVLGGTFVKSYKNSSKLISCNCALSYIVNKSYYQTLLTCFKDAVKGLLETNRQSKYAIDQAWKPLQRRDNWYVIKPNMCKQLPSYSNIENVYKDYTEYFNNTNLEYDYDPKLEFSELRYENDDRFNDNNNTNWKENKRLDKKQIIRDNPHLKHHRFSTVNQQSNTKPLSTEHVDFHLPKHNSYFTTNSPSYTNRQTIERVDFQTPKLNAYFKVNESLADQPPIVERVALQTPNPTTYFSVNESLADQPPIVESVEFQTPKDNKYFTVKEPPYTKPPPINKPIFQHQKNTPVPNILPPSSKLVSFRQLINLSKTN